LTRKSKIYQNGFWCQGFCEPVQTNHDSVQANHPNHKF
jgi:hypothetical protein